MTQESKPRDPSLLGGLLVRNAGLTLRDLQAALDHQRDAGGMVGEILLERGLINAAELATALAQQAKMRKD